jgi:fatty acid desaturase 3 (Delta-13 desaturase)
VSARRIPFDEVGAQKWLVVGDDVYDVTRFAEHHPGGRQILELRGSEATLPLINAHGVQGNLPDLPRKLRVGEIDESTLPAVDRDLRALWRGFLQRGLFRYRRRWLLFDVARGLALWALAWWCISWSPPLAFVCFVVARLNVIYWVHDVCHDSVFANRDRARFWAEWVSLFFVGTPVLDYQYIVHRIHHGFTNLLDADQALNTGPVVWHHKMLARSSPRFVAVQAWIWFLIILPLTLPFFLGSAIYSRAKQGDWGRIGFVALRWAVARVLFGEHVVLLIAPVFVAGYLLSLTASLNHFHRPISERPDPSFARWVTNVTQNLRERGPLARWFTGGLNFHIEHHFFATMPRRNYPVISAEVQAFCARHGLPYNTCSLPQALRALWHKLNHPFAAAAEAS